MRIMALFMAMAVLMVAATTTSALAQDHPCQSTVEQALAMHGMKLSDVEIFGWRTDRFAQQGGGDGPIDGYRFYGRPQSCESGELSIELGSDCGVEDVYTHGGCRIKGIPHMWW